MRISLIKSIQEKNNWVKLFRINVVNLENYEEIDKKIEELLKNNYKHIIISNEIAGFSEDIIKKYATNQDINIYIAPSKRN